MSDSEIEAIIDRRVQARLSTDRDYLFAENADEQALAERKIELQEERAVLLIGAVVSEQARERIERLDEELADVIVELRKLAAWHD